MLKVHTKMFLSIFGTGHVIQKLKNHNLLRFQNSNEFDMMLEECPKLSRK